MPKYASDAKAFALSAIATLVLTVVGGCGSEPEESTTIEPATNQVAAAPAATPEPTTTPLPEPTATPVPLAQLKPDGWTEVDHPAALFLDQDTLDADQVEEIWTNAIYDVRHYAADGSIVVDTCADGTGVWLAEFTRTGQKFTWVVKKDPGGRWNEAYAHLEFIDTDSSKLEQGGTRIPLAIERDDERKWGTYSKTYEVTAFESPDC